MAKLKSSETLSLDMSEQRKVSKQTKKLKEKIQDGTVSIKKLQKIKAAEKRGLLFISHLPHGFYEEELKKYFQQFGKVTNVMVCRSRKTGNCKGYGYIEFLHPEVAKIAAETMNNYLMFKKRITAQYVPYEKRPKNLFMGKSSTETRYSSKIRREKQFQANNQLTDGQHLRRTSSRLLKLNKKLEKLKNYGIQTKFTPVDVAVIKQEVETSSEELTHTFKADPFDSDVEIKIPLQKYKKSVSKNSAVKSKSSSIGISSLGKAVVAKSLDTVKTAITIPALKKPLDSNSLIAQRKISKATSIRGISKPKKKVTKSKGITKKKTRKPAALNADTVRKIARELIRKRGTSLLNSSTVTKNSPKKKIP